MLLGWVQAFNANYLEWANEVDLHYIINWWNRVKKLLSVAKMFLFLSHLFNGKLKRKPVNELFIKMFDWQLRNWKCETTFVDIAKKTRFADPCRLISSILFWCLIYNGMQPLLIHLLIEINTAIGDVVWVDHGKERLCRKR